MTLERAIKKMGISVRDSTGFDESYNSVVRLLTLADGSKAVLKLLRSAAKLEREEKALELLQDSGAAPQTLALHAEEGTWALLMSYLPGQPLESSECTTVHAREIGAALARIHLASETHTPPEARLNWWERLGKEAKNHLSHCRKLPDEDEWKDVAHVITTAIGGRRPLDRATLVHFDFRLGNILFDSERVSGVVDFESSRFGDPALDFAKIARELEAIDSGLLYAVLAGYGAERQVPAGLDRILPLYALYESLSCVAWCVKANKTDTPFFRTNRAAVSLSLSAFR